MLLLAGCAPQFGEDPEETIVDDSTEEAEQETAIIPTHNLSEDTYRVLVDSSLSQARGLSPTKYPID